jgi:hypothetical protein
MKEILKLLKHETLKMGTIVRRINDEKDQQGCFVKYDEDENLILVNVIDLKQVSFLASEGLLKREGDEIYYYESSFKKNPKSTEALNIIKEWALYEKNPELQKGILRFVQSVFVPQQIIQWQKEDTLVNLFVPIQQKFRIGRFKERRNPDRMMKDQFRQWLEELQPGDHLTYVAMIPQSSGYKPGFFSAGTRPHQVTESVLLDAEFNFQPTHAGHVRVERKKGTAVFYVDAGSNYLGRGNKTPIRIAKEVSGAMAKTYPDFTFIPLQGRDAFGNAQSY